MFTSNRLKILTQEMRLDSLEPSLYLITTRKFESRFFEIVENHSQIIVAYLFLKLFLPCRFKDFFIATGFTCKRSSIEHRRIVLLLF